MLYDRPRVKSQREADRAGERGAVEELLRFAEHLPPRDRALVEAVFRDGRSTRLLAAVGGGHPATVAHRLRRVLRRLRSPEFRLVALRGPLLDPADRRAAEALFLRGLSVRAAARHTGRPLHRVRRVHDSIRHLVALLDPTPPSGGPR